MLCSFSCTSQKRVFTSEEIKVLEDCEYNKDVEKVIRENPFSNLQPMLDKINKSSHLILYKGLPHQGYPDDLERELNKNIHEYRHDFPFYKNPIASNKDEILKIVKSGGTFTQWEGFSNCGGFHPDYSIVLKTENSKVEIHVCFGCNEIKAYSEGKSTHCCITYGKEKVLLKILKER